NVAFATGVGPAGTNRLAFTYTVAAPTAGDEYWVRAVGNAATELGTPSVPVGGDPNDNPTIELDGPTPGTGDGLGTTSPYILGNADVASTYTFSVYDSV